MTLSDIGCLEAVYQKESVRLNPLASQLLESSKVWPNSLDTISSAKARSVSVKFIDGAIQLELMRDEGGISRIDLLPERQVRGLIAWAVFPDHKHIAIIFSEKNNDQYHLAIISIIDGARTLVFSDERVSPTFRVCGQTLFWVQRNTAHRPFRVLAWKPGSSSREIYVENDSRYRVLLGDGNERRSVLEVRGDDASEILMIEPQPEFDAITVASMTQRNTHSNYSAALLGEECTILDSVNQTFCTFGEKTRILDFPEQFIGTRLAKLDGNELYMQGRLNGNDAVWFPSRGKEAVWTAPLAGRIIPTNATRDEVEFAVTSPVHVFQTCFGSTQGRWIHPPAIAQGLDARRLFAQSSDGTSIPITLYRSSLSSKKVAEPVVTIVYGCYGISLDAMFDPLLAAMIASGITVALCHVRGGGEYGYEWHNAARGSSKHVAIDDYLACVEFLASLCEVDADRIGVLASSAGAIVAANAVLLRPELFKAMQLVHPFLTPEIILKDESEPLTATDWIEFGDPRRDEEQILQISPLSLATRFTSSSMPKIWIRVGTNDFRAPLWSVRLWIEALTIPDDTTNPALVLQAADTGHTGHSDLDIASTDNSLAMAWLVDTLTT